MFASDCAATEQAIFEAETFEFKPLKRTDIHRPSVIRPEEYEYVGFEYIKLGAFGGDILGDCIFLQGQRETIRQHEKMTGAKMSLHQHGGSCYVCGASAIYTVRYYHRQTNTYIRTGQDCAQKMDMSVDGDFNAFRTAMKHYTQLQTGKRRAIGILAENGLDAAWAIYDYQLTPNQASKLEEPTIQDIVSKLVQYGSITEKQMKFVGKLLSDIEHRAEIEAQRAAEKDAATPVPHSATPNGRMVVTGVVLTLRQEDTPYGLTTKMLVQADAGWKVWGSLPKSLYGAKKGDKVEFAAQVTHSPSDPKFGFFSRPTQGKIIY